MAPEIHRRVRELFDQALDKSEGERPALLEAARAAEPEIAAAVERLLDARRHSTGFLSKNPASRKLGRYLITGELGSGAMGIVYAAVDPVIGRNVALKAIRMGAPADAAAAFLQERLVHEARSIGALSHPGIVVVFDVGQEGDLAFIAMELVEGQSLQQLLAARHRLEPAHAVDILRQAGGALDYAHRNAIVHRDIKPANIMLHHTGVVKIADFGIAKIATPLHRTASGITLGTPTYMSPEQIGMRPVDARSDQFSLGVVAYEMLVGTRPFQADTLPALAHQIVYAACPSAHAAAPFLAPAADAVFRKVLSKLPEERYPSCLAFADALAGALEPRPAARVVVGAIARPAKRMAYAAGALAATAVLSGSVLVYRSASVANLPFPSPSRPPSAIPAVDAPRPAGDASANLTAAERAKQLYAQGLARREQGHAQALPLFRQAAELGDPRAMVELAEEALQGDNQERGEALRWFQKAAAAGDTTAMLNLGLIYETGDPVPEDYQQAVSWYRRAADGGNPPAMYDLGRMYQSGRGVSRNLAKALDLYRRAAALGNTSARTRLAQFAPGPVLPPQ